MHANNSKHGGTRKFITRGSAGGNLAAAVALNYVTNSELRAALGHCMSVNWSSGIFASRSVRDSHQRSTLTRLWLSSAYGSSFWWVKAWTITRIGDLLTAAEWYNRHILASLSCQPCYAKTSSYSLRPTLQRQNDPTIQETLFCKRKWKAGVKDGVEELGAFLLDHSDIREVGGVHEGMEWEDEGADWECRLMRWRKLRIWCTTACISLLDQDKTSKLTTKVRLNSNVASLQHSHFARKFGGRRCPPSIGQYQLHACTSRNKEEGRQRGELHPREGEFGTMRCEKDKPHCSFP